MSEPKSSFVSIQDYCAWHFSKWERAYGVFQMATISSAAISQKANQSFWFRFLNKKMISDVAVATASIKHFVDMHANEVMLCMRRIQDGDLHIKCPDAHPFVTKDEFDPSYKIYIQLFGEVSENAETTPEQARIPDREHPQVPAE